MVWPIKGFRLRHFAAILGRGQVTVKGMQGQNVGMPEDRTRLFSGRRRCARNVSLLAKTRKEVEIKKILTCCARPNYNNALLTATFVGGFAQSLRGKR